jgi:NTE family protein
MAIGLPHQTETDSFFGGAPTSSQRSPSRRGAGLCLSGGGFRATLFHLGAVRRLNELGVLHQFDEISSVSGGSILAAQLAAAISKSSTRLEQPLRDFDATVAEPIRRFTRRNRRTIPLLRRVLLPWNWLRSDTAVRALADIYRNELTQLTFEQLPERPQFVFCATDLTFGTSWTFERSRIGDYQAGYMPPSNGQPIAIAVAASSCFPPVFNPLRLKLDPKVLKGGSYRDPDRDECIRGLRVNDGGNYDNLGLEPIWKDRAVVLASDGGGAFEVGPDQGLFWRVARYASVVENQARSLRRRWLQAGYATGQISGAYFGISSAVSRYKGATVEGYPEKFAKSQKAIANIRTDLDAFSEAEAGVLENHGYSLAEAAVRVHATSLITNDAPYRPPCPEWDWTRMSAVTKALRKSGKRKLLGRWR